MSRVVVAKTVTNCYIICYFLKIMLHNVECKPRLNVV